MKYFLIFLFFISTNLFSEEDRFLIKGTVRDSIDQKILPYSTIAVLGTSFGCFTNLDGSFSIELDKGKYRLAVSMTGYQTQYLDVDLKNNIEDLVFDMSLADYVLESFIVYAEGPGLRIMRRLLDRKKKQKENLKTYTYQLYTKFVIATDTITAGRKDSESDTTITSILESYSKSYFKREDNYFNYILKKRQTSNIPPQANFVSFGNNINVYDDYVEILNEMIYSPMHPDAPDFYNFVLEGKFIEDDGRVRHKILIEPKKDNRKMFKGYVIVDSINSVPVEFVLEPNKSVQMPFNAGLEYRQHFEFYNDEYVMPSSLRIFSNLSAEILWLYSPRLEILLETYQYDYDFNIKIDDRIFNQRKSEADENANEFDSTFWQDKKIMPLRFGEEYAYQRIETKIEYPDSIEGTSFFSKSIKPITDRLRFLSRPPLTGLEDFFKHNRVSGVLLGIGLIGDLTDYTSSRLYMGYGLEDKKLNYNINLNQYFDKFKQYRLGLNVANGITRSDNPFIVKDNLITYTSIFGSDAGDYYYNEKYRVDLEYGWGQREFIKRFTYDRPNKILFFGSFENHNSADNQLKKALSSNEFRDNPEAISGKINLVGAELSLNYNRFRRISNYGLYFSVEHSDKKLNSLLDYTRYYGEVFLKFRTLPLWNLSILSTFGWNNANLPPQKYFALESGPSIITVPGSFRTIRQKEFYGDKFYTLNIEHNFGEIFPGLFRIPSLTSFGLEFILMGNIGYSEFSAKNILNNKKYSYNFDYTKNTKDNYFYEFGIGMNKLFLFFRFDITARLSQLEKPGIMFNISGATYR